MGRKRMTLVALVIIEHNLDYGPNKWCLLGNIICQGVYGRNIVENCCFAAAAALTNVNWLVEGLHDTWWTFIILYGYWLNNCLYSLLDYNFYENRNCLAHLCNCWIHGWINSENKTIMWYISLCAALIVKTGETDIFAAYKWLWSCSFAMTVWMDGMLQKQSSKPLKIILLTS